MIGWLVVDGPCGMIGMEGCMISDTLGGEVLLRLRRRVPPEKNDKKLEKTILKVLKSLFHNKALTGFYLLLDLDPVVVCASGLAV